MTTHEDFLSYMFRVGDDYDTAMLEEQEALDLFADLDRQLAERKAELWDEVAAECDLAGKPKFSSEDKRKAERNRRLATNHSALLDAHAAAERSIRHCRAEVERLGQKLLTIRTAVESYTHRGGFDTARSALNAYAPSGGSKTESDRDILYTTTPHTYEAKPQRIDTTQPYAEQEDINALLYGTSK